MSFDLPPPFAALDAQASSTSVHASPSQSEAYPSDGLGPMCDKDLQELRERFKDCLVDLDPTCIGGLIHPDLLPASPWAIRCDRPVAEEDPDSLENQFLHADAVSDMPVLVRRWPTGVALPADAPQSARYEVIVGNRRWRLQLRQGQKVLVVLMTLTNEEAARLVVHSNRSHRPLKPYEWGLTYERLLVDGVFPTQRSMAEALRVQESEVTTSLKLVRLDPVLISAFATPLDLQHADGVLLERAWIKDPETLRARALQAAEHRGAWNRQKVLRFLLAEDCKVDTEVVTPASERIVEWEHQRIFTIVTTPKGKTTVDVAAKNLSSDRLDAFLRHLEEFVQSPAGFGFIPPKR